LYARSPSPSLTLSFSPPTPPNLPLSLSLSHMPVVDASTPGSFVTVHCVLGVRVCVRVGPGVGYVGEFGRFYSTRG
jgi:hypothetical protein